METNIGWRFVSKVNQSLWSIDEMILANIFDCSSKSDVGHCPVVAVERWSRIGRRTSNYRHLRFRGEVERLLQRLPGLLK